MEYKAYFKKENYIYSFITGLIFLSVGLFNLYKYISAGHTSSSYIFITSCLILIMLFSFVVAIRIILSKDPAIIVNAKSFRGKDITGKIKEYKWEDIDRILLYSSGAGMFKTFAVGLNIKNAKKIINKQFGGLNEVIPLSNLKFKKAELLEAIKTNALSTVIIEDKMEG